MTISELVKDLKTEAVEKLAQSSPRLKDLRDQFDKLETIASADPTRPVYAHGSPFYSAMMIPTPSVLHRREIGGITVWNFECEPEGHRPINLDPWYSAIRAGIDNQLEEVLEI